MRFHTKNPKSLMKVNCALGLRNHQKYPKKTLHSLVICSILNRNGIFWIIPGDSSCPYGSEYVWQCVTILSPIAPITISLFIFELEAKE